MENSGVRAARQGFYIDQRLTISSDLVEGVDGSERIEGTIKKLFLSMYSVEVNVRGNTQLIDNVQHRMLNAVDAGSRLVKTAYKDDMFKPSILAIIEHLKIQFSSTILSLYSNLYKYLPTHLIEDLDRVAVLSTMDLYVGDFTQHEKDSVTSELIMLKGAVRSNPEWKLLTDLTEGLVATDMHYASEHSSDV